MQMDCSILPVNSETAQIRNRLGNCEVCQAISAKYTCPKCEVKTCCLSCFRIHKQELLCNGIRDRTKFIPLKNMSKTDFLSDYYFLEECTRFVENRKHDRLKRCTHYNKVLPKALFRLRKAAAMRKTTLRFLLDNFSRRKRNTSYLDSKHEIIYWRIEWVFTNAENIVFIDEKCCEDQTLANLLDKYLNPENCELLPRKKHLECYQSKGVGNLHILLKAEGAKSRSMFYRLDYTKTLKENLSNKILVEYPCIHVTYDGSYMESNIINSDDENGSAHTNANCDQRKIPSDSTKNVEQRKAKRRVKPPFERKEFEKVPVNYLFSNENQCGRASSSSESDGNETENGNIPRCSSV